MTTEFNTTKDNVANVATVAALVCLANPGTSIANAKRGVDWLARQCWGAAVHGDGFTTFKVDEDFGGAAFSGYFRPTLAQVANDCGPGFWSKGPKL